MKFSLRLLLVLSLVLSLTVVSAVNQCRNLWLQSKLEMVKYQNKTLEARVKPHRTWAALSKRVLSDFYSTGRVDSTTDVSSSPQESGARQ